MSYLVLARKWRPTTFSEVIGQEHVTVTLKNAITNNRLASAYIFSGPRGVGKTTTARILAKALNCEKGPTTEPCNVCDVCKEITAGNSIDVLEIDGASNRGIDEIRNLRESTRYTSAQQRSKIYIIDEVHMLTTEAFNALLKTLEEPPPHVIFIFATTEVNKIPSTILSRCQRFDFRRIPTAKITSQLKNICSHENISIAETALALIAGKSEGCMRDSQSLLDQVISFCGTDIQIDDVSGLLGIIGLDVYIDILGAVADKNTAKILTISKNIYEKGYSYSELLDGLAEYINKVLIFKSTADERILAGKESFVSTIKAQAELFYETDLLRLYQAVVEATYDLRWSNNHQLHVEMMLVRLTKMTRTIELEKVLSELDSLKKKALAEGTRQTDSVRILPEIFPQKQKGGLFGQLNGLNDKNNEDKPEQKIDKVEESAKVADPKESTISFTEIRSNWKEIIALVKREKISIGSFLEEGSLQQITGNQLEIAFESSKKFHVKALTENRILVQKIISSHFKIPLQLEFTVLETTSDVHRTEAIDQDEPQQHALPTETSKEMSPGSGDKNWISRYPAALALIESLDGEEIN
ncbi:MAG: DNA polymerase III subunit gamma/tau [Deferribacteres bacterium]|nr:DNA polymerase III subunit gamma/tau [Deferribacteres bacterium]